MNDKRNIENEQKTAAALKAVLRLGHEAFARGSFNAAATHILNNSSIVLKYDRSCLASCSDGQVKLVAVSGQGEVNSNSEYSREMSDLLQELANIDKLTLLTDKFVEERKDNAKFMKAMDYFRKSGAQIAVAPFLKPGGGNSGRKFFWVIEFFDNDPEPGLNIINLLSMHYGEALWFYSDEEENLLSRLFHRQKHFSTGKVLLYTLGAFVLISFFRVSQNVAADFELIPYDEVTAYAPYAGTIESAHMKNGQKIEKGDTVLSYDTQELSYKLLEAKTQADALSAELDWIKQQSFSDKKQLGKVKILALQLQEKKIEIEKNKWYLDNAVLKAEIPGTLVMDENEKWKGRAVRAGEKLFEIVPSEKINAEVMLNENNASVLGPKTQITLYLHSMPEIPVSGKIISVSPKPMLTETGQFSYIIKMKLDNVKPGFIVGMRGVARVKGEKVSIGYYLFKNIVLWWRKI